MEDIVKPGAVPPASGPRNFQSIALGNPENTTPNGEKQAFSVDPFYVADDIKRFRRTKAKITEIKSAIFELLSADHPQTVRQVFYALTVRGLIAKVEIEYQRTVARLLGDMREAGQSHSSGSLIIPG